MHEISFNEMGSVLANSYVADYERLTPDQAAEFLTAVSTSIDWKIANTFGHPTEVEVKTDEGSEELALGIVPKRDLIAVVSSNTGLSLGNVEHYMNVIETEVFDGKIKPFVKCNEVVRLAGFGTFTPKETVVVFNPEAFEYMRR